MFGLETTVNCVYGSKQKKMSTVIRKEIVISSMASTIYWVKWVMHNNIINKLLNIDKTQIPMVICCFLSLFGLRCTFLRVCGFNRERHISIKHGPIASNHNLPNAKQFIFIVQSCQFFFSFSQSQPN